MEIFIAYKFVVVINHEKFIYKFYSLWSAHLLTACLVRWLFWDTCNQGRVSLGKTSKHTTSSVSVQHIIILAFFTATVNCLQHSSFLYRTRVLCQQLHPKSPDKHGSLKHSEPFGALAPSYSGHLGGHR